MKSLKTGKITAALAAAWMCLYSLAVPASAAAAIGLYVTPEDGETISSHVEGEVNGWESEDGYFDTLDEAGTTTDHRGRGVLISDVTAGGEDVSVTFNGGTDVTTKGKEGGIGVHVFSMDKKVTAKIEGEPIRMKDVSDNGRNAAGIMVHAQAGGKVDFTSTADVEAVSESPGIGLDEGKLNHIYGIYLRNEQDRLVEYYYIDGSGRKIPVTTDDANAGSAIGVTLTDSSGFFTDEQKKDLYNYPVLKPVVEEGTIVSYYDFYFCKADGTLVAWSKDVSSAEFSKFNPNTVGSDPVEGEAIAVTVYTSAEDPGKVVTIKKALDRALDVAYDINDNYFVYDKEEKKIYSIQDENNTAYELHAFTKGTPVTSVDISGNISAEGSMEADALAVSNLSGTMNVELQEGTSLKAQGSLAAGISVTCTKPYTIKGEEGGIDIRAIGVSGEESDAIGILSSHGATGVNSEISITGGDNSIYVETDRQSEDDISTEYTASKKLSAGILTYAMSFPRSGTGSVRFEGSVEAVGNNVHGIYGASFMKGISETTVIGDVTVKNSLQDGIYADENYTGMTPITTSMYDPKTDIYVRGNLTMEDAGSTSSGIAAFGGTVIVDGNVEVTGAPGTSRGPIGIYAEGKRTIVLVTDEITAPVAVLIPSDDPDSNEENKASVYVWKYQDSSRGKTDQIGFVLKIDDQEELKDVTLESSAEHFVALKRDGYTYYGARAGDTITVKGAPSEGVIKVLDANDGEVEVTDEGDGTYTFTVPEKLGALVTLHKHTPLDPVKENEKEASCEEPGSYDEVVYCEGCGEELSRKTIEVEATDHKYGAPVYNWSEDNSKVTAKAVCENDSTHILKETAETTKKEEEPTCTESGKIVWTAEFKNELFEKQEKTETGEKPTGHKPAEEASIENEQAPTCTMSGSHEEVIYCSECGEELSRTKVTDDPPTGHTSDEPATENTIEADCTHAGTHEEVIYCKDCGAQISRTLIKDSDPLGHNWSDWETVTDASEDAPGEEKRTCQRDSCGETQTRPIPALTHEHEMEPVDEQEPTCTEAGFGEHYVCKDGGCEGLYFQDEEGTTVLSTEDLVIPATGHTPDEVVTENVLKGSCTSLGSHDEVVYCKDCGEELSRVTVMDEALSHKEGEAVTENEVKPGCTTAGSHDEVIYCSECGEELKRTTVTDDPAGHVPGEAVREKETPATCTGPGRYDEVVYCTVCETELSRRTVETEPTGHDWGEWEVTKPATELEEGEETRTCNNDSTHTETRPVPVLTEHRFPLKKVQAKKASCTEDGNREHWVCETCKKLFADEKAQKELTQEEVTIPATGHDWGEWKVTKKAGCTTEGRASRTCSTCGETEIKRIRPTGHDWGDWVITRDPASNIPGERTRTCKNDASHVETETIPATGEPDNGDEKDIVYTVTKGDGSKWTKGSGKSLPFTVSRNTADSTTYDHFTNIQVDDKTVDPSNYTAASGSLNVSLKPAFLETLSTGEHTITAVFDDGRANAKFTVVKKSSGSSSSTKKSSGSSSGNKSSSVSSSSSGQKGAATGDTTPVAMWAILAAAAAAGIGVLLFLRGKKTKHGEK
ncbi:MAG: hypothetical protein Q4F43_09255 [Eubacteriales bacterium]|nr:hypothetical protein [Eubacteriales bacterium]